MEKSNKMTSRLLVTSVLEPKDELDEKLDRAFGVVNGLTNGLTDAATNDILQKHVCKGPGPHEEVQLGLLYSILTSPKNASKCCRELALVSRDGLANIISKCHQIVHEKWMKLQETARVQMLWYVNELVTSNVQGADSVCHSLIRQIAGGDVSQKNVWLTETLLDVFVENKGWLEKHKNLMTTAVYTYLRVIVDHGAKQLAQLRQREVTFCVNTLREKWVDCMSIGRDLVRLMQYTARIPEIEALWKDILNNPTSLHPTFTGIQQLMQNRTSRWYFASRLTPDMENKLFYLTTKVKFGQQKRYQDWFQRQYLSLPESQSLRYDLIRYICAVIHPSNEVLCSDIIPRWAVIGWLLTTCTSNVAASNAKLSLFYDWLFFEKEKDNIMNIEPCILVMYHSMRPHPAITATLLDFMCRIMSNFYPPLTPMVRQGIYTALRTILEKRVLQSLSPLFDNNKLDKELRSMIRENFIEFCSATIKDEAAGCESGEVDGGDAAGLVLTDNNNSLLDMSGEFSDDDDDALTIAENKRPEIKFTPIQEAPQRQHVQVDISQYVDQLDGEIKQCVIDFHSERENEIQCEMMDRLIQAIIQEELDEELAVSLASALCAMLAHTFTMPLYPHDPDEESIEDSIGSPLYVIKKKKVPTATLR